jgi:deaminated glutathione amidase
MPTGRLGLGQLCSSDEKESNFEKVRSLVDEAARQGVDLLSLPECFAYMGARPGSSSQAAEPLSGPLMKQYMDLAARSGMWLALGEHRQTAASRPPPPDAERVP